MYCNCETPIIFYLQVFLFSGLKCIPTIKFQAKFTASKGLNEASSTIIIDFDKIWK